MFVQKIPIIVNFSYSPSKQALMKFSLMYSSFSAHCQFFCSGLRTRAVLKRLVILSLNSS